MANEIRLRDTGEVLSTRQFRARHPNTSFPPVLDADTLDSFNADPVLESPKPTTDRLHITARNGVTQDANGNWVQAWTTIDIRDGKSSSELADLTGRIAEERVAEIEARHAEILDGGFAYDFGTKTATLPDGTTEPAGVRTIQTRPGDRERWQATMQVAQQYIVAGAPTEPMRPFRTEDNASIPMTAQDVADCLNAMQAHFGVALDALWTHKDAVRSLTTVDDVVAYDIRTGWPT